MRWHIVWSLIYMPEKRIAVRDQTRHESLQIGAHLGVGILTQNKGGAGMVDENQTDSGVDTAFSQPLFDFCSD
jgi:hypothetical protein